VEWPKVETIVGPKCVTVLGCGAISEETVGNKTCDHGGAGLSNFLKKKKNTKVSRAEKASSEPTRGG